MAFSRFQWFPPRIINSEVENIERIKIWAVDSRSELCKNILYFLYNGELTTGYDCSADYRHGLLGNAANVGVGLTHQLLDKVFNPIDSQIMALYLQVRGPQEESTQIKKEEIRKVETLTPSIEAEFCRKYGILRGGDA